MALDPGWGAAIGAVASLLTYILARTWKGVDEKRKDDRYENEKKAVAFKKELEDKLNKLENFEPIIKEIQDHAAIRTNRKK